MSANDWMTIFIGAFWVAASLVVLGVGIYLFAAMVGLALHDVRKPRR